MWDSSGLLDDSTVPGGIVAGFTGYRARPSLMTLLAFALYWLSVLWMTRPHTRRHRA